MGETVTSRPKLSDVLYSDMLAWMGEGRLTADARLPSEKDLSVQFGVSRPIVREALRRLREEGLIYSRQGAGSFVSGSATLATRQGRPLPAVAAPAPGVTSIAEVRRIYEYRLALEGGAAFVAAVNRTDEQLEALALAMEASEKTILAGEPGIEQDAEFHMSIVRATQNHYFEDALAALKPQLEFLIGLSRTVSALQSEDHMALVQRQHRSIYMAIKDGNSSAARDAVQTHIRDAEKRIFDGIHV